ncbi:MAG: hypothetical protein JXB10_18005 [Pirellulales bacterium]|nr:hypothetical protein [Pirellulales bacterium]
MQEILFGYKVNPTTWAYLSSLLTIGIYFKFHRFWSVRNLDLLGLICYAPGLLLIYYGFTKQAPELIPAGYVWLFTLSGFFLIRMLLDPIMVRRPLLEPNLNVSGLTFTGVSLLVFLMANVIRNPSERLETLVARQDRPAQQSPGFTVFDQLAGFSSKAMVPADKAQPEKDAYRQHLIESAAAKTAAILAHLAIIVGIVLIGYRHFENLHTGVAVATLYLLCFYTSQMTGQVYHVVPAALLVCAVAAYRRPLPAGLLLGMAAGAVYYPLYLLPLWCGYYWRRGLVRFLLGVVLALAILIAALALHSPTWATFLADLRLMFGVRVPWDVEPTGFWQFHEHAFRTPVIAAFVALCGSLAIWPPHKNLGTLLSCSTAVMIAVQFWHFNLGGIYLAWYLPLLLLTIFRPNLEDRVALIAVIDFRRPRRRAMTTGK